MSVAGCAAIVERGDPDRFLATMAAPVSARAVLFPLYAFNVEVTRAAWVSQEPMICEMRLQWWLDAITEVAGQDQPRSHEVVTPLAEVVRGRGIPHDVLRELVTARRWDVYREPFAGPDAFAGYLEATSAGLMWAAARALGAGAEIETVVRDVGWASGLASYLRAIPDLEARGRRPLVDGRPDAVRALAHEGLERLARARKARVPAKIRPALLAGWRAGSTLQRAASDPGAVARGELGESEFARRAGLLRRSILGGW